MARVKTIDWQDLQQNGLTLFCLTIHLFDNLMNLFCVLLKAAHVVKSPASFWPEKSHVLKVASVLFQPKLAAFGGLAQQGICYL